MSLINIFYNEIKKTSKDTILLDIGANTGAFCFLPLIDKTIKTYSFEPNPLTFEILEKNIKLNNLNENMFSFNLGVWSENKFLDLKVPLDLTDSGLSTFGETPSKFIYDNKDGEYKTVKVECITIDDFVKNQNLSYVSAIKIDTEGSELEIIKGGEKTLREFKPIILLEYFDGNTEQFGYKKEKIVEILTEFGYTDFSMPTKSDIMVK